MCIFTNGFADISLILILLGGDPGYFLFHFPDADRREIEFPFVADIVEIEITVVHGCDKRFAESRPLGHRSRRPQLNVALALALSLHICMTEYHHDAIVVGGGAKFHSYEILLAFD